MVQAIQKHQVLNLLVASFADNSRMLTMLRSAQRKHLQVLFNYIYVLVEQSGQIFVSNTASTVLLYFQQSKRRHCLKSVLAFLKFVLFSLSWKNLRGNIKVNKLIKKIRQSHAIAFEDHDYYYVWFLAGKESTRSYSGMYEAMEHLKIESLFTGLPIYIETTVPRMISIYERAGFHFYAKENCGNQIVWFGKYQSHGE